MATKHPSKLTYSPIWYVYTNDPETDHVISEHLKQSGRHDEDHMPAETVSDIMHDVPLWRVRRDDIDALKRAKKSKGLDFRTYLQVTPDGPIFNADQDMPKGGARKVVLIVSSSLAHDEMQQLAEAETAKKKMVSYLILWPSDKALTRDFLRRGFIQEIDLHGDHIDRDLGELLEYAQTRSIRVVPKGANAERALHQMSNRKGSKAA
jgi:hypothetical protein